MNDSLTKKRIVISTHDAAAPSITVPASQQEAVESLLRQNAFRFTVAGQLIATVDRPAVVSFFLGIGEDVAAVQRALDNVP